jgi:hypothetical protein
MLAFLQAYSGLPAFHASACAPRVLRVSICLMKSDGAILITGVTMSPGDGIVTGSVHFSDRHDLHPFLNVVTKCHKDGQVRVGVMNTTMEPIVIPVGTKYGSFSRIIDASNHSEHPFCIAIINNIAEETAEQKGQLPRRRPPKRQSQLTRLSQSWHPGWLGPRQQRTEKPGLPT